MAGTRTTETHPEIDNNKKGKERVVISQVVETKTLQEEKNQIVVKAWATCQEADRSNTAFSDKKYVLISSNQAYILFTLIKDRGDHFKIEIENVKDTPEKIPVLQPVYTYSYYTLDPSKLIEYFNKVNAGQVEKINEYNPMKLFLKKVWSFLAACGMDKLVRIVEDADPSPRLFSIRDNRNGPRNVLKSVFNSIDDFGNNPNERRQMYHVAYIFEGDEYVPLSLLANAKFAEVHNNKITLRVPGESDEIHYRKDLACRIL